MPTADGEALSAQDRPAARWRRDMRTIGWQLRLARVNGSAVFFTLLDSARSLHTLTTPLSLSTAPAAPGRSLKFTLICGLPATRTTTDPVQTLRRDTTWRAQTFTARGQKYPVVLTQGVGEKL